MVTQAPSTLPASRPEDYEVRPFLEPLPCLPAVKPPDSQFTGTRFWAAASGSSSRDLPVCEASREGMFPLISRARAREAGDRGKPRCETDTQMGRLPRVPGPTGAGDRACSPVCALDRNKTRDP